ncbi:HNH endonuclease [Sphingosinicella sp.]|uniref:HNH endonuclease n=1 Tax=Sphingosinicella sp. TaxID=1917971 RepID=UPI004037D0F7
MVAYFHNLGMPVPPATMQSLWDSLRGSGTITAGFGNEPGGRGQQVLRRYQAGDTIFAYANGFGVVGYGIAEGPQSYRLVANARRGSNHRHEARVSWQATAGDIHDALPPFAVRQITHHLPRQTSEKVSLRPERLREETERRWPNQPITRAHVLAAFQQVAKEGYRAERRSTRWDVLHPNSGDRYPPKVILSRAAQLAGVRNNRGGGWPTNDVLAALGFMIVPKEGEELEVEQDLAQMDLAGLRDRAEREARQEPPRTSSRGQSIARSPWISAYAKRTANGRCDLCGNDAPFRTAAGPFLECHHILRLADGGPDCIENVVALCPNCHRRMHLAPRKSDISALRQPVTLATNHRFGSKE